MFIRDSCGAQVFIVSDTYRELLQAVKPSLDKHCQLYIVGDQAAQSTSAQSWSEQMASMPDRPIEDEAQGLDMLYSSGTTGRPKGIKWPLPQQKPGGPSMLIELLTSLFAYAEDTRYLCPAPLYHAAPLRHTMVTIKMGGCAIIMPKFDPIAALSLIENERITHSQWVPTMFVRLLKLPKPEREQFDLSSMRMVVHAAAPCPVAVKHQMIQWWGPITHEYYAGTENNGFTSITTDEWLTHEGSVGQAKLGTLHICDEHGKEIPIGSEGEVYFENGHQFAYHNDDQKTADCTNAQGWTTLGDIGRVDTEGYLYLTDRKSFLIISGGVNVYPQETEDVLLGHPAVMDAAVIGVPSEEFGEEVKAIVQLTTEQVGDAQLASELMAYCRTKLSGIKCPKSIEFRSSLPRSPTGKLYKRKLRAEYWP